MILRWGAVLHGVRRKIGQALKALALKWWDFLMRRPEVELIPDQEEGRKDGEPGPRNRMKAFSTHLRDCATTRCVFKIWPLDRTLTAEEDEDHQRRRRLEDAGGPSVPVSCHWFGHIPISQLPLMLEEDMMAFVVVLAEAFWARFRRFLDLDFSRMGFIGPARAPLDWVDPVEQIPNNPAPNPAIVPAVPAELDDVAPLDGAPVGRDPAAVIPRAVDVADPADPPTPDGARREDLPAVDGSQPVPGEYFLCVRC